MFTKKITRFIPLLALFIAISSFSVSADEHEHEHRHEEHDEPENQVEISEKMAKKVGIKTRIAGPQKIEKHLQTYGRLITPPDQTIRIRARFPGVITSVKFNSGDRIKKGDVLAVIESNENLQRYDLKSPVNAIIQVRNANQGETTSEQPLFVLINNDRLWAELKLFPSHRNAVKILQSVHIYHTGHLHESTISSITPAPEGEPYVLARVELDNKNSEMAPGDLVSGAIAIESVSIPLAVDNRALQTLGESTVVFIQRGDVYQAQSLELGRSDGEMTEVLSGLNAGDHYVVENSYLIKADILKSGASHEH